MDNKQLMDEVMDRLAKEMAEEIDFDVIATIKIKDGWHSVKLDRFKNNNHAIDIRYWAEEHSNSGFINRGTHYVFEDAGDAVNFTMRWA